MLRSLLYGILEMRVGGIAFFGVYVAIAVMRNFGDEGWGDRILRCLWCDRSYVNFGDEGWGDRFFEVFMVRSQLCKILEMRVGAIAFFGYGVIALVQNLEGEAWGDRFFDNLRVNSYVSNQGRMGMREREDGSIKAWQKKSNTERPCALQV